MRSRIRSRSCILLPCLLPVFAPLAHAGPADQAHPADQARPADRARPPAKRPGGRDVALPLFKKGIEKFDGGYYRQAIKLFKQAYFHFPSPKIHTRIALCYKWLGNNLKALEHYERYLKLAKERDLAQKERVLIGKVKVEVKNLLLLLGQLRIEMKAPAGAEIRVNGKLLGTAPLSKLVRLPPGSVNVTAIKKGYYAFKRDLDLPAGKVTRVSITLVKIKPKVVKVSVKTPVWKKWWFWTAVGVLAAGAAAGAGVGYYYGRPARELKGLPVNHDSLGARW
jgi:hypothetical protein